MWNSTGGNLGPLLFTIYVNDLSNCIKRCSISLYADDTCIYYPGKTTETIENVINADLIRLSKWLNSNKLFLNTKKCEVMLIGSRTKVKNRTINIYINDVKLNQIDHCKYLGIYIDHNLDWDEYVNFLRKDIIKKLYLFKRIRNYISQNIALMFYKTILQSKLDYCDVVWRNIMKKSVKKLQVLQNRALRIILKVDARYSTISLFQQLKLDFLEKRRDKHALYMMYKIANHNCPNYLLDLFELKKCNYNMRNSINNFVLPKLKTCLKKKSFSYFGAKCWNSISPELKRELSVTNFKRNLNKYMEPRALNE